MTHLDEQSPAEGFDIAIIGMAGRFPGASTIEAFWHNLCSGVTSIKRFDDDELKALGADPARLRDPRVVKAAARLEDIELFDAAFFHYSPHEAEFMDPQQRIFLECAWEALERAGYDPAQSPGLVGLYAGVGLNTYLLHILSDPELAESIDGLQATISNDKDYLTTRVSYKLNLKGPSINVQSACSTSLVAIHLACQALLNYECDMALAGGVSIRAPQPVSYLYQEGGILSPDGYCRAFDANAQGTVFGNGVGIVVLKRLQDAIDSRDTIYAVVKGSALNNDGAAKIGYTAPSMEGQADVISSALAAAGVNPETIGYIEAHGTGTPLGDPIEVAGLTQAFRKKTRAKQFCALGSVKPNIGHLDTAAGVAGLIKAVLALKHRQIPPSLNFEQINPQIEIDQTPFYINTRLKEWRGQAPLRASVSSFGIGGTNAHMILEEGPVPVPGSPPWPWHLLALSARSESALESATANLRDFLKARPDTSFADLAYTYLVGRHAFEHRRVLVCRSAEDALAALESADSARVFTSSASEAKTPLVFMFPGQGAQYVGMGRELYQEEPAFRAEVDRCAELLKPQLGLDIRDALYPAKPRTKNQEPRTGAVDEEVLGSRFSVLDQTQYAQPALFVIEYALAKLLMAWGIQPEAMIGHSIGEYVAACLAGVFSLEDGLAVVAQRARLMQQLPPGAMLAVELPEQAIQAMISRPLGLSVVNGPSLCVVAGPEAEVEALRQQLANRDIRCRLLHTSHAFHSEMMDPILETFGAAVRQIRLRAPALPYLSNLTGTWITAAQATDPNYWVQHLRQTVRCGDGLQELLKQPGRLFLEVGPGRTLSKLVRQQPGAPDSRVALASLREPQQQESDLAFLLTALGKLWLAGARIDWTTVYARQRRQRLPLPTYPFERQRYWVEAAPANRNGARPRKDKKRDLADWFYAPLWKQSFAPSLLEPDAPDAQDRCTLVFVDQPGFGMHLAQELKRAGETVITVRIGADFAALGPRAYAVNPRKPADYEALVAAILAAGDRPGTIAHLWSISANDQEATAAAEAAQYLGFYSLIFLVQALNNRNAASPVRLDIISNNAYDVLGTEELRPEKTTLLGPCRVIPQEYPGITCQHIDIVLPPPGSSQSQKLANRIAQELRRAAPDEVIAYRGDHRWVQTFEPLRLAGAGQGPPALREGGVYMITGGLGGLGLALAEHLATAAHAKLILVSRSGLPPRDAWPHWLATHDEQEQTSKTVRKVQELEAIGAEVLVISADVTRQDQLREALARTYQRFGALHGLIHAAGVPGAGLIQLKTPELADNVLGAKLYGTLAIDAALADAPLDFVLLFSSITAVSGGVGQVDYCAANAFLSAFAQERSARRGKTTIAVDWDAWQLDTWQELSMAAMPEIQAQFKQMRATYGIATHEGLAVFDTVLRTPLPHLIVSTRDLYTTIANHKRFSRTIWSQQGTKAPADGSAQRSSSQGYVAPRNEVESAIVEIWQEVLGVAQVGVHDSFIDLGGHSLLAIQLVSRLRETFQVELPLRTLFEKDTVAHLAEVIIECILTEVESLSHDGSQA